MQLSTDLFELTDKDWTGYGAAVEIPAPKKSNAMVPAEPFGPLPVLMFAGSGERLYQIGADGVSLPNCTYMPHPSYSDEAQKFHLSGTITIEAVVNTDGRLENVRIVRGLSGGLNEHAIATLKTWRCNPARKDDHSVATLVPFDISFRSF